MAGPQEAENASTNRRDAAAVVAEYAAWLPEQPLSARTRETYLAAVRTFVAWLGERDGGVGEALSSPRGRDLAARDYKRRMKVERGLAPASVNQALAGLDHLFRFLGLGAAIVRREELPRAAPRALDREQQRDLLRAGEESSARDRAIVGLLLFAGLRLSEASALQLADVRISARKGEVGTFVTRRARQSAGDLDSWVANEQAQLPGDPALPHSTAGTPRDQPPAQQAREHQCPGRRRLYASAQLRRLCRAPLSFFLGAPRRQAGSTGQSRTEFAPLSDFFKE
jgi:site-specific recombinase XerC